MERLGASECRTRRGARRGWDPRPRTRDSCQDACRTASMVALEADRTTPALIERAVAILRAGGLVAFPTETVYGLGGRALDPVALAKIFAAKGRPATHPLIAHVLGVADARTLAAGWSGLADRLAEAFWPGPLTLVVARAASVPLELTGGGDSVGIRAPAHRVARALLEGLGEPIAAPSANRYQTLSPTTAAHVAASLDDRVDMILDGGPCSTGIESTVVDLRGEAPVILRPGALDFPTLAAVAPTLVDSAPRVLEHGQARPSPGMESKALRPQDPARHRRKPGRRRRPCRAARRGRPAGRASPARKDRGCSRRRVGARPRHRTRRVRKAALRRAARARPGRLRRHRRRARPRHAPLASHRRQAATRERGRGSHPRIAHSRITSSARGGPMAWPGTSRLRALASRARRRGRGRGTPRCRARVQAARSRSRPGRPPRVPRAAW